ncbi:MAG: ABC transporter permease [Parvibaculaceae bacterium]
MTARALRLFLTAAACLFLVLPLLVIIPVSFSDSPYLAFPPPAYSLRWYHDFFTSEAWIGALVESLKIGVMVGILATVLAYLVAVALTQDLVPFGLGGAIRGVLLFPLIIPVIVIAIAVYGFYADLKLVGTRLGIVMAHTVLALPVAYIILEARLTGLGRVLTLASESLGATWWQTTWHVTLPLVRPAFFAAFLFAFFTSFDEAVIVNFIGGTQAVTLPKLMFSYLRTELQPTVASAATLLVAIWIVGFILFEAGLAWRKRSLARAGDARAAE